MEDVIIRHVVEKGREGSYYTIPFRVPAGVAALTVSYEYPNGASRGAAGTCIDLGIEDAAGRFLGWSGSARASVTVGEHVATPGYLMETISPGSWHIIIGAYRVQPEGVAVTYRVSFEMRGPQWLFGDLHVHSDASDGQYDIPTLARIAVAKGLDFLAVTDHNNFAENLCLPRIPKLTLIPGVEWTHYKGHMNFLGVARPFTGSFIANSPEEMLAVVRSAHDAGAVVCANHPKCDTCPYLWPDDRCIDMVEIWNGPMRQVNIRGIAWWTSLLAAGRHVAAVGGSDFHRDLGPVRLGNPVTAVWSRSRGADDILAAAAAGRCYITSGVHGARLALRCGEASFGDTVPKRAPHDVEFSAERMPPGSFLRLVGDSGELARAASRFGHAEGEAHIDGPRFAYLAAMVDLPLFGGYPLAVSNPIYFEE